MALFKKVFIWTNTLQKVPPDLIRKVEIVRGNIKEILHEIHQQGFHQLYVNGGKTIQSFLQENLLHEMIITIAPILLGRGMPLFKDTQRLRLKHLSTQTFDNGMVQTHYEIKYTI